MLVAVISCNVDVENVELSGYVYDSNEGEPIKNAIPYIINIEQKKTPIENCFHWCFNSY